MPAPPASPTQEPAFTLSPGYAPLATNAPTPTLPPFIPVPGQIVFTSELDGRSDLYIINSDGSGFQRLTDNGNSNRDPVWSPDGAQLAFTSLTLVDEGTVQASEIYVMNADGSGQTSVTLGLRGKGIAAFNPAWSPNGSWLAFSGRDASRLVEAFNTSQVYVMDARDSTIRQVTLWDESEQGCDLPQWLPDGYRMVVYCQALMSGGLVLLDAQDGSLTRLNDSPGAYPFAISHDGQVIAFADGGTVHLVSLDGSSDWLPIYLSPPDHPESFLSILGFAWSLVRDDQMAAVASTGLYLIHVTPDGWEPQEIIGGMSLQDDGLSGLGWSPDGSSIVFPSTVDSHNDLFVAPLDGTGLLQLTQSEADESQPVWRP